LGPFSFWLSLPQLITWGSVFYTFSLLMTPLEAELGMSRAESSLAFSLALLADLMLVSSRARLAMVFHRIGLVPDVGAWYTLPRAVGLQRAKELIYSAREFGADEAVRMNMALEVTAPEALLPRALQLAQSLAMSSPTAFSLSKQALQASLQSDFNTMLEMEATAQAVAGSSEYFREAIRRFAAREPAQFNWPRIDKGTPVK
jgi:enoyl-CoA hydratase/carnithine racemase